MEELQLKHEKELAIYRSHIKSHQQNSDRDSELSAAANNNSQGQPTEPRLLCRPENLPLNQVQRSPSPSPRCASPVSSLERPPWSPHLAADVRPSLSRSYSEGLQRWQEKKQKPKTLTEDLMHLVNDLGNKPSLAMPSLPERSLTLNEMKHRKAQMIHTSPPVVASQASSPQTSTFKFPAATAAPQHHHPSSAFKHFHASTAVDNGTTFQMPQQGHTWSGLPPGVSARAAFQQMIQHQSGLSTPPSGGSSMQCNRTTNK